MAQIVEAVNEVYNIGKVRGAKLFLAGGITNCPDWLAELIEKIKDINHLVVYNPRRKNFPIHDPNAAEEQIVWEYEHLSASNIIVFWFSRGSLNPIVLFELGRYGFDEGKIVLIGLDPEYERKMDVTIQTMIGRKYEQMSFYNNLDDIAKEIIDRTKYMTD